MTMLLSQLIPELLINSDITIDGLADDSRCVQPGDLFLATPGLAHDARDYVDQIKSRAAAVVCEAPFAADNDRVFALENLSMLKGVIASRFWQEPSGSMQVVGITGTNGKTSCSHFIAQALGLLGRPCGVMGTLGFGFPGNLMEAGLTTPMALDVQRQLASLRDAGAEAVTIESSSHGLVQGRLNGTRFNVAVFTNISRDHLDYHASFEAYQLAKQQLFEWPGLESAVVNSDDAFGRQLCQLLRTRAGSQAGANTRLISYSLTDAQADVHCGEISYLADGITAALRTPWGEGVLRTRLLGTFNISNCLATIAVLGLSGYRLDDILRVVGELDNVRGRMDTLRHAEACQVVVDYAHTPDALEKALKALRPSCTGRLWCVFGCGGDRDRGKRPEMGRVSTRYADISIVTDDNPRTETSAAIIEDVLQGVSKQASVIVQPDRRLAIEQALAESGANDIVLIAGKGHEEYQEIMGKRHDFSDYQVVTQFYRARASSKALRESRDQHE